MPDPMLLQSRCQLQQQAWRDPLLLMSRIGLRREQDKQHIQDIEEMAMKMSMSHSAFVLG